MAHLRTLLITVVMAFALAANASGFDYLVVEETDNTQHPTLLTDFDQIRFTGGWMVLYKSGMTVAQYRLENLRQMFFQDDTTGIDAIMAAGECFDVYSVAGTLIQRQASSIDGLNAGVYVVRSGERTIKVVKK